MAQIVAHSADKRNASKRVKRRTSQGLVAVNIRGADEGKSKEAGTEGSSPDLVAEKASKTNHREGEGSHVAGHERQLLLPKAGAQT